MKIWIVCWALVAMLAGWSASAAGGRSSSTEKLTPLIRHATCYADFEEDADIGDAPLSKKAFSYKSLFDVPEKDHEGSGDDLYTPRKLVLLFGIPVLRIHELSNDGAGYSITTLRAADTAKLAASLAGALPNSNVAPVNPEEVSAAGEFSEETRLSDSFVITYKLHGADEIVDKVYVAKSKEKKLTYIVCTS